ncbi:5'-3' exonuclease [Nocardioides ultimimeridianus]
MEERLLLLDTASMYFRAYFGSPEILAPDGTNVNAVRGLLGYISQLVEQYRPTHLVCCWDDDWRPQWRVDLIPSYKAHRVVAEVEDAPVAEGSGERSDRRYVEEVPDPLQLQVPVIREVLGAFGIAVIGAPGYEADDVIGTLATGAGMPVDIVTGDRDLFQLVSDAEGVRVLYIGKGVGRHERVDEAWVLEKYGVRADQYADFATLRGDSSDGLPGVKGVGEKTAAALLTSYGSLDGVVAAAEDRASAVAGGVRLKIAEAADYLAVAPKVVAVARDIPLDRSSLALPSAPHDGERLEELASRWGLTSSVNRLLGTIAT